jgi:hypothetical protein
MNRLLLSLLFITTAACAAPPTSGQYLFKKRNADGTYTDYGVSITNGQAFGLTAGIPAAITLGGGGGGDPTWGTIQGTLADQTDLIAALNAKLSTTAAASAYQPLSNNLTTLSSGLGAGFIPQLVTWDGTTYARLNGALSTGLGGTGLQTYAIGDMLYVNPTGSMARLAGNTSATKKFLSMTGNGTSALDPVWEAISANDIVGTWGGSSYIQTLGTVSSGVWQASAIADAYISSAATWNAKESQLTFNSPLSRSGNTVSFPASTSVSIGVGTIELGHASDTTLSRGSAGVLTVEGINVLLSGGPLGTPSSGTATNLSGTAASLTAGQATAALGLKTATTTVAIDSATAPSSGQVLTATGSTTANWQTPSGGGGSATTDNRLYTTDATWTNPSPSTPKRMLIRMHGGGGGGGSGRKGADGSVRCGGGGAAAGCFVEFWALTTDYGSTVSVTVGAGGAGGAAQTANSSNGNNGTSGGNSVFGDTIARGGQFGAFGSGSGGAAGLGTSNGSYFGFSVATPANGSAASTTGLAGTNGNPGSGLAASSAASGGGITAANAVSGGGAGGDSGNANIGIVGGGSAGSAGNNGGNGAATRGAGTGGGGGGSSRTGNAGNGGNGGGFGAPGGGGGAALDSVGNSGAGGNGSGGYILIITFL